MKKLSFGKQTSNLLFIVFIVLIGIISTNAAVFTVTKTADTNDGICDADCSLREAITAANNAVSNDVIEFDSALFSTIQTIQLNGTELAVANNGNLTINGSGANLLFISGFNSNTFVRSRVLYVAPSSNVVLNGLRLYDGNAEGAVNSGSGGGIFNDNGVLTINDSVISNNFAAAAGAGIFNASSGTLNINNSVVRSNVAVNGGGIANISGSVIITNSEISNNTAQISGGGGGIDNSGNLTVAKSTFSGNRVNSPNQKGGGLLNTGIASLANATFGFNSASRSGGAISNSGNLTLQNATVAYNNVFETNGNGGGINNDGGGVVNARNTIFGKNIIGTDFNNPNAISSDFNGTLNSQGYNLIQSLNSTTITGNTTGNILNGDPLLSNDTGQYGGPTLTFALKINSPAIDAADPNNFPATDQRGFVRPVDGDGNGSALPDIGAYETSRVVVPSTFVVTNTNDDGAGSLRNAIEFSNATFGSDTINFDPAVFSTLKTITLTKSNLAIAPDSNLIINGPGVNLLNISSNQRSTIFFIQSFGTVEFNNLTISEGSLGIYNFGTFTLNDSVVRNNAFNGGIFNFGNAAINNSVIRNNTAQGNGGGIRNSGTLTINNSTIADNTLLGVSSSSCGGGIANLFGTTNILNSTVKNNAAVNNNQGGGGICGSFGGEVNLTNVTVANNSSTRNGGGILNNRITINITNSTIARNNAALNGGGVANIIVSGNFGTVNLTNSISADNTSQSSPDFDGTLNSQGYNLIENISGTTITGTTTGNITGVDPKLAPSGLKNNGGVTETIALLSGSPAIDAADPNNFPSTDQRGFVRPVDGDGNGSALPDIGAFERQLNELSSSTMFDFDGDGKSDISVFRPSNGVWYLNQSQNGFAGVTFGLSTDLTAPADFDGDGKTDVSVFRPANGTWYRLNSSNNSFAAVQFGQNGDSPRPADFDGDGKADISVFRPSNGAWYRLNSSDGSFFGTVFGQNGDKPLVADFDGDGKSDIAVFRSSNATFYWTASSNNGFNAAQFGLSTDIPTPGDYDGDGKTDIAVFRPSNGTWYRTNSSNGDFSATQFGTNGDIPAAADYDGDGKTDIAVFRPSNGTWYYTQSSNSGFVGVNFGISTDKPIPVSFQ